MILSVWKNLSRGLTALLAVSILTVLISGCAGINKTGLSINDPFYAEYYAAKKLDSDDIIRLRGYAASPDVKTSDAASLIIGHYYLKNGDRSYGDFLINKYYNSPVLTEQMKIYGKLWKAESLMATKKPKDAEKITMELKKTPSNEIFAKTLGTYCSRLGITVKNNDFNACIDSIIKVAPEAPPVASGNGQKAPADNVSHYDNMTYEEYAASLGDNSSVFKPLLDKNSVINIVDGEVGSDYVQGMIYAISNLGTSYQINSIGDSDAEAQKYAVNIKSKTEAIDIEGVEAYIGINWEELGYIASNLKFIDDYDRVIIASPDNMTEFAKNMEKRIKSRDKYVKTINYSNRSFQTRLKDEVTRSDNQTLIMIGLGNEKDLLSFIPIAKYLQTNSVTQRILLVTSAVEDVKNDPAYGNYFKDVYVLAPIRFADNAEIQTISGDFERFFGLKMTADNMIGYDTIIYINSLIDNNPKPAYLTNIVGFINNKAYRPTGLYKFDKLLQLTQTPLELITEGANGALLLESR